MWISSRPDETHTFSIAGGTTQMQAGGPWLASYGPRKEILRSHPHLADYFDRVWRGEWGDRRHEVVFLGQDLDRDNLTARFDACLLTDKQMAEGATAWYRHEDLFAAA